MALFFSIVGGMRKDLSMSNKCVKAVITDFELSKYNRDLCARGLKAAKRCRDVLEEVGIKNNIPTTPSSTPTQTRQNIQSHNGFVSYVENSKELQKLGDCLFKLSTFSNYVVTINVNTCEVCCFIHFIEWSSHEGKFR